MFVCVCVWLVCDFVESGLLVTGAGDNVLLVARDVAAEHTGALLGLKYGGAVGRAPRVQVVVLARRDEPLARVGELEREHAALVQVQLVLVGLARVQHLDVAALHADGEPVASRTIAEREYLRVEVVLAELAALAHIPRAHRVVQAASEDARAVGRYVDAAGAVRVSLKLLDQLLIVHIPDGDVAVRAAAEADLRVGRDGERVAGGRLRAELALDARRRIGRQVPYADRVRLAAHNECATVGQQLATAYVAVARQAVELMHGWRRLCARATGLDVPDLHAALAARVHVSRRIRYRDGAHDLAVCQAVDQLHLARHTRRRERVGRKGSRLDRAVRCHVERIGRLAGRRCR